MSDYESVYSPETIAAGERQLVIARNEFSKHMVEMRNQLAVQQAAVDAQKQELANAGARVREEEAENWRATALVRSERANLEHEAAVVRRDKEFLAQQGTQLKAYEDKLRRNRTVSVAFIEDHFSTLSPSSVVQNLTNSSLAIRKHAMANISACIGGFRDAPPTFVRFTPQDIAPDILPKLHQLVSSSNKPLAQVLEFAQSVVSAPPIASALARAGQCTRLADYLIETNEHASELAIRALRCMVGLDTSVVKSAYEAMSLAIPHIPVYPIDQPPHPSVDFVIETAPKIIENCFSNGLWLAVAPLVNHRIPSVRKVSLRKIVLLTQHSDRNQHGVAESHILGFLDSYYQAESPPGDILDFFADVLPLVSEKLCRGSSRVQWLLVRLGDPSPKITTAVISAFRSCLLKQDPAILDVFVRTRLIKRLDEPPTQQSYAVTKLLCQMLPVLAIPHARAKATEDIISFLDHGESEVAEASLMGIPKYVFGILRTQKVWGDLVSTSPSSHSKIIHDGFLDLVFELCRSQYEDAVRLGAKCCSCMALEITKTGVTSTRQIVELLNHPNGLLRQAALRGIQLASEGSDLSCKTLLDADLLKALYNFFETYPKDLVDNSDKILTRLTPFLYTSYEACIGLLQLVDSRVILREAVLNRLQLPTEPLIEFATNAIQTWIGPDLILLNDFEELFELFFHSNLRIQSSALISLRQRLTNVAHQESLEKANITSILRSLSSSDNPEALTFVSVALRTLALILAQHGHVPVIIDFLDHKESKVREGAIAALEAIAGGPQQARATLVEEGILETLISRNEHMEQTHLDVMVSVIPKLAVDYLEAGRADLLLDLVDHLQQQIRAAATRSVMIFAGGTPAQKARLRDALLPRLGNASAFFREVAASCLTRSLAYDLVADGDFIQVFRVIDNDDRRVREPVLRQLQIYIEGSDEMARRRVVDAGILQALLQAYSSNTKDDILTFLVNCVLPKLGPSFTMHNGGATLFPLLQHSNSRLRTATVQALRNAIDSRHGSLDNLAKASSVATLFPFVATDDTIRDLWCRMVPRLAPFLIHRAEIDILFECLRNVCDAAYDALSALATTSETTRGHLFPALLHHLDNPSPHTLPLVARVCAVDAATQLLAKGSSFEHQQLMKADIFIVALKLYDKQSHRQLSLKLLHAIVSHLSYAILQDEELAREMFTLFDDPDTSLSTALYQTWSNDPRVYASTNIPELLPLLFSAEKLSNPSATALLCQLATDAIPKLVARRRLDIIVEALKLNVANVVQTFLREVCEFINNSNDTEKGLFVSEPFFVPTVGKHLKGRDPVIRRDSSTIIQLLSKGSATRSGRIMNEGIGRYLSEIVVNGEKGAQQSSLQALFSLFTAAPDYAEQLVVDCLPALQNLLKEDDLSLPIYFGALRLLAEITHKSFHSAIVESGIVGDLVRWLSPRHSITDMECRHCVFNICEMIAQQSDAGRKALIEEKILLVLSHLATSRVTVEVVSACKILRALAHSGTFESEIISSGMRKTLKRITSPIQRSTLQNKEDKLLAQAAAKEALHILDSSKRASTPSLPSASVQSIRLRRSRSNATNLASPQAPDEDESNWQVVEQPSINQSLRRAASEHNESPQINEQNVEGEEQRYGHIRSLSDSNLRSTPIVRSQPASRPLSTVYETRQSNLRSIYEGTVDEQQEQEHPTDRTIGLHRRGDRLDHRIREVPHLGPNSPSTSPSQNLEESVHVYGKVVASPNASESTSRPYTRMASVSGSVRRRRFEQVEGRDLLVPSAGSEDGLRTSPPTYRTTSVTGDLRN
ncbi:hypothetical protein H0H92_009424 [Tricholoma furcatifolium]|nr:hypothetical protein H0H92_009424 [Tricholoma furcatifolium]